MKIDYINGSVQNDFVRCTFVGYDKKGRRRPVIDLDTSDLRALISLARDFRRNQRRLAAIHNARIVDLTTSGLAPEPQ